MKDLRLEEAFYYRMLMYLGFHDEFYSLIDEYINSEDEVSQNILDIYLEENHPKRVIDILGSIIAERTPDANNIANRIQEFINDFYYSNPSKKEVMSLAMNFYSYIPHEWFYHVEIWNSYYYFAESYELMGAGYSTYEGTLSLLEDFLEIEHSIKQSARTTLGERIKNHLRGKYVRNYWNKKYSNLLRKSNRR